MADDPSSVRPGTSVGIDVDNTFYAGYLSAITGKKSIVGTFTVPALGDCSSGDQGIWSGLELDTPGFADFAAGGVFSSCVGGTRAHNPVFDTTTPDGQVPIGEVVEDRDKIMVIAAVRRGKIRIRVENLTQGWSANDAFTGFTPTQAASLYSKFFKDGTLLPPLDAGLVPVTGVTVGGMNLGLTDPTRVVLVDDAGDPLVIATRIRNETDFKYKYVG